MKSNAPNIRSPIFSSKLQEFSVFSEMGLIVGPDQTVSMRFLSMQGIQIQIILSSKAIYKRNYSMPSYISSPMLALFPVEYSNYSREIQRNMELMSSGGEHRKYFPVLDNWVPRRPITVPTLVMWLNDALLLCILGYAHSLKDIKLLKGLWADVI